VNLLLVGRDELEGDGRVALRGRRAEHLRTVVRAAPGDHLRAGVIRGPLAEATVIEVSDQSITVELELEAALPAPPTIDLLLAVPRPKALARVLQSAASMGVRRIDLINAWRVDKSYLHSHRVEDAALRRELVLGCEQGATTWVPDIAVHRLLMPYLDGELGPRLEAGDPSSHRVLAHPRGEPIEAVLVPGSAAPVVLAVGPEGGWIERELRSFGELGFRQASAGDAVMRVESALPALLAQIALLRRLPTPP
jgi:RsmE family RNA methyltransferase